MCNADTTGRFESNPYDCSGYLSSRFIFGPGQCYRLFRVRTSGYQTGIWTNIHLSFLGHGEVLRVLVYLYYGKTTYLKLKSYIRDFKGKSDLALCCGDAVRVLATLDYGMRAFFLYGLMCNFGGRFNDVQAKVNPSPKASSLTYKTSSRGSISYFRFYLFYGFYSGHFNLCCRLLLRFFLLIVRCHVSQ